MRIGASGTIYTILDWSKFVRFVEAIYNSLKQKWATTYCGMNSPKFLEFRIWI